MADVVIYFKSGKALNHLLREGFVYTLRDRFRRRVCVWVGNVRECPVEAVKTSGRSKPVAKAAIQLVGLVDLNRPKELEKFVKHSGFGSVDEWVAEFRRLSRHHGRKAVLYRVELVERVGSDEEV